MYSRTLNINGCVLNQFLARTSFTVIVRFESIQRYFISAAFLLAISDILCAPFRFSDMTDFRGRYLNKDIFLRFFFG